MKGQVNCIKIKQKNNQSILNSIEISNPRVDNTDNGAKIRVQCRDIAILYLAFIVRNLFLNHKNRITIKINIICRYQKLVN